MDQARAWTPARGLRRTPGAVATSTPRTPWFAPRSLDTSGPRGITSSSDWQPTLSQPQGNTQSSGSQGSRVPQRTSALIRSSMSDIDVSPRLNKRRSAGELVQRPRIDISSCSNFYTGPPLAAGAPYDWDGTFPFRVRFHPTSSQASIMAVPEECKPQELLPYKPDNVDRRLLSKYRDIRAALLIVSAPDSVYRSGQARCSNCVRRAMNESTCNVGCISADAEKDGPCAECRSRGTSGTCDLRETNAIQHDTDQLHSVVMSLKQEAVDFVQALQMTPPEHLSGVLPSMAAGYLDRVETLCDSVAEIEPVKLNLVARRRAEPVREAGRYEPMNYSSSRTVPRRQHSRGGQGQDSRQPTLGSAVKSLKLPSRHSTSRGGQPQKNEGARHYEDHEDGDEDEDDPDADANADADEDFDDDELYS